MLDYSQIRDASEKAGRKAKRAGTKPLSIRQYTGENFKQFCKKIPFLGDYTPQGWDTIDAIQDIFVDSSGLGGDNEPAISLAQFKRKLDNFKLSGDNYGFGVSEAGEFQVYIRVYRPDRRDFTHTGALTDEELNRLGSK